MSALPRLLALPDVQLRLEQIFPTSFPDRAILVGDMSAKVVFVGLYGGFIDGTGRFFRPSTVIRFSLEQGAKTSDEERTTWLSECHTPGYRPLGKQWYADNTREPVRDDYIRNRAIPMGLIKKREGFATTSPAPIYTFAKGFAALFDPNLTGEDLDSAISEWRERNLDPMVLKRMRLAASGIFEREGELEVKLPNTGQAFRLSPGEAALITKDVVEKLSWLIAERPIVVHLSMSDVKTRPELARMANDLGLEIDPKAELPDVIIADVPRDGDLVLTFVEVVHSDGPITELRKQALLDIAKKAGIPKSHVTLITAFDDRNVTIFKKRVSELAIGSSVWFRTEPNVLLRIDHLPERSSKKK